MFEYEESGHKYTIILSFVRYYSTYDMPSGDDRCFEVLVGSGKRSGISIPSSEYKRFDSTYKAWLKSHG